MSQSDRYRKLRDKKRAGQLRIVIDVDQSDVDQLDLWAVDNGFTTRAAALRHIIKVTGALSQQAPA